MKKERRRDYECITTTIALIQQDLSYVKATTDEVKKVAYANEDKLIRLNSIKQLFESHVIADRWLFGLLFAGIFTILVKLFV